MTRVKCVCCGLVLCVKAGHKHIAAKELNAKQYWNLPPYKAFLLSSLDDNDSQYRRVTAPSGKRRKKGIRHHCSTLEKSP